MIIKLSKGNPGALSCLMGLFTDNLIAGLTILPIIENLNIVGTDLYVFWSDLCGRDYEKMVKLCNDCPGDVLKDACSRQDYSGKDLVKKYLD